MNRGEVGIEAAIESDKQRDLRLLHRRETLVDPLQRKIDRFLTEDRLAGLRGRDHELGMGVGRGRDDDRAHFRVGERRARIDDARAVFQGKGRGGFRIHVDHVAQRGAAGRGKIGGVNRADPTGAKLSECEHEIGRRARSRTNPRPPRV